MWCLTLLTCNLLDNKVKTYYIDASGLTVGRLVNLMKKMLQPSITQANGPHPYRTQANWLLLVENCSKILANPTKINKKRYYFHSGCPGGLRTLTWRQLRLVNSEKVVELAFHRVLPSTQQAREFTKKVRFHRSARLVTSKPRSVLF